MPSRCQQKILEIAQNIRPDRVALIGSYEHAIKPFIEENVEVVKPEIREQLLQLVRRKHRALELGLRQFAIDGLYRGEPHFRFFARILLPVSQKLRRWVFCDQLSIGKLQRFIALEPLN